MDILLLLYNLLNFLALERIWAFSSGSAGRYADWKPLLFMRDNATEDPRTLWNDDSISDLDDKSIADLIKEHTSTYRSRRLNVWNDTTKPDLVRIGMRSNSGDLLWYTTFKTEKGDNKTTWFEQDATESLAASIYDYEYNLGNLIMYNYSDKPFDGFSESFVISTPAKQFIAGAITEDETNYFLFSPKDDGIYLPIAANAEDPICRGTKLTFAFVINGLLDNIQYENVSNMAEQTWEACSSYCRAKQMDKAVLGTTICGCCKAEYYVGKTDFSWCYGVLSENFIQGCDVFCGNNSQQICGSSQQNIYSVINARLNLAQTRELQADTYNIDADSKSSVSYIVLPAKSRVRGLPIDIIGYSLETCSETTEFTPLYEPVTITSNRLDDVQCIANNSPVSVGFDFNQRHPTNGDGFQTMKAVDMLNEEISVNFPTPQYISNVRWTNGSEEITMLYSEDKNECSSPISPSTSITISRENQEKRLMLIRCATLNVGSPILNLRFMTPPDLDEKIPAVRRSHLVYFTTAVYITRIFKQNSVSSDQTTIADLKYWRDCARRSDPKRIRMTINSVDSDLIYAKCIRTNDNTDLENIRFLGPKENQLHIAPIFTIEGAWEACDCECWVHEALYGPNPYRDMNYQEKWEFLTEKRKQLEQDLIWNKRNLSAERRRKTSAEDSRPSAVAMGYSLGVAIVFATFGVLVLMDLPALIGAAKLFFRTMKELIYGPPPRIVEETGIEETVDGGEGGSFPSEPMPSTSAEVLEDIEEETGV